MIYIYFQTILDIIIIKQRFHCYIMLMQPKIASNYRCICTERCRVTQGKLHWSPNPEGVCDFLGNHKPPMTIYGKGVCDLQGLQFTATLAPDSGAWSGTL